MGILVTIVIILVLFEVFESYVLCENRRKIPIRIHVNGSRGKSSVTRLIAAGLRAGGIRTVGKTTGTAPYTILPDGSQFPLQRRGKADIIEQVDILRVAREHEAEALVVECMAIRPDFQRVCEQRIIQSTLGVISNVRADHLDQMGPRKKDVARALCGTLPKDGTRCFTAESDEAMLQILREHAEKRDIEIVQVREESVSNERMQGFRYLEHRENVALALAVCSEYGVEPEKALQAMREAEPDPGVLRSYHFREGEREVEFINAFAANDPDSILKIWDRMSSGFKASETKVILLNARKDRLQRSEQLAELIAKKLQGDFTFLIGDNQEIVKRKILKFSKNLCKVKACGKKPIRKVYEEILKVSKSDLIIFAIGNIGGGGQDYVDFLVGLWQKNPSRRETWTNSL